MAPGFKEILTAGMAKEDDHATKSALQNRATENLMSKFTIQQPELPNHALSRVMCIEDNQVIRDMLHLALADLGHLDVCSCESGEQAIETLPQEAPDLILLDWDLPGLSGPATLDGLRQMTSGRRAPVVLMTFKRGRQLEAELSQSGVLGLLHKPLDPMHLASRLRRLHADAGQRAAAMN